LKLFWPGSDINLGYGVADKTELTYFMFNEPALNSFEQVLPQRQSESIGYRHKQIPLVIVQPARNSSDKRIDFMSIDVGASI
jgi:hypothetical protein